MPNTIVYAHPKYGFIAHFKHVLHGIANLLFVYFYWSIVTICRF